jgi:hypothetical protein
LRKKGNALPRAGRLLVGATVRPRIHNFYAAGFFRVEPSMESRMNLETIPSSGDAPRRFRPRLLVDVDAHGPAILARHGDVTVLYQGRLWLRADPGCAPCMTDPANAGDLTLKSTAPGADTWVCLAHGPLARVRYRASKSYEIKVGPIVRRANERTDDFLLLPASMTRTERRAYLERLLDQVEAEEREEEDAFPEDAS